MAVGISSYPSVYTIGHKAIENIFQAPVVVEEKVDGSQFSAMKLNGELICRSKGANINPLDPPKLFELAVEAMKKRFDALHEGWAYRGEAFYRPKHNVLEYDRIPKDGLALFDVSIGLESYLAPSYKKEHAEYLDLEVVPVLYSGKIGSPDFLKSFLERESFLGGPKLEGVVVKNYDLFTSDKKAMFGKYVSEAFKEIHVKEWGKINPKKSDIVEMLAERYSTEPRWRKVVEHQRDEGRLENTPRDIGILITELREDIERECEEDAKDFLWSHYKDQITRKSIYGFPEWYKEQLLESAFEVNDE